MIPAEMSGRVAVAAILAVIGTVALMRACDRVPDVIVWWLVYALGSGIVLNSAKGERTSILAVTAVVPAVVPIGVLGFFGLAEKPICLSLPNPKIPLLLPLGFVKTIIQPNAGARIKRAVVVIQLLLSGIAAVVLGISELGK